MSNGKAIALLPIGVFLVLYLGLGFTFEFGIGIEMGFYQVPIVPIFLIALLVACLQNRQRSFDDKLGIMAKGIGDKTLTTMVLIFLVAGIFVGTVGRSSAESVAYFMLSIIPAECSVVALFIIACFVSISMGTSVGTITLITPIAISVAQAGGFSIPLCVGAVMGGAMFGDNLSFISDTTIAACQGQGCKMKDKFRENFKIALPAAFITLCITLTLSLNSGTTGTIQNDYNLIQLIPYLLVLIGGIIGFNVFAVLIVGIVSGAVIMLGTGTIEAFDLLGNMGTGVSGMFETTMVAILVTAICALVRDYGGFDALLNAISSLFKGKRGGQIGIGLLVLLIDIATANNTVAIIVANPIASEMGKIYGINKRRIASLLDTFSCVSQGIIPYGAQMLVALAAAATMNVSLGAFEIIPCLFYPFALLVCSLGYIAISRKNK